MQFKLLTDISGSPLTSQRGLVGSVAGIAVCIDLLYSGTWVIGLIVGIQLIFDYRELCRPNVLVVKIVP